MNKLIIPIITILIIAAGIGTFFVFQKPALPEPPTPPKQSSNQSLNGKCGDEICDDFEKKNPSACPTDCQQTTQPSQPSQPTPSEQSQSNLLISKQPTSTQAKGVSSVSFVKKVEISSGARPEIVATDSRVFAVYRTNTATFSLKIFDTDMNKEIASKTLIEKSGSYGMPTDIRVASDGKYLYAFYETADMASGKIYLFGVKYSLDDTFDKMVSIGPISTSKFFSKAVSGDEKLDDPIVLIAGDSVFAITRYKASSEKSGDTKYKVYEFTKELSKKKEFDLDLSSVADGESRQSSAIYHDGYYYMLIATTVGKAGAIDLLTPSDLVVVKLDANWNVEETKNISTDKSSQTDAETYITGFKADSNNFYLTYLQVDTKNLDNGGFTAPLKIYDNNFNLVVNEKVRTKQSGEPGLRPSLELRGDTIFVGHDSGALGKGNAEVYIYKIK